MNILLIDPQGWQGGVNVGIAYLSSSLENKGHSALVLDLNNSPITKDRLKEKIIDFKPDIIGFSIKTATYYSAVELSKFTKENFPDILHVAGGPHITLYYEEFLSENTQFNVVVIGEGEFTLLEICDAVKSGSSWKSIKGIAYIENGKAVSNGFDYIKNLDELPFPFFKSFNADILRKFNYPLVT